VGNRDFHNILEGHKDPLSGWGVKQHSNKQIQL